jgi:hypothetical protein
MLETPPLANLIPAWNPLWLRRAERQISPPIDGYQGEIALLCTALRPRHFCVTAFSCDPSARCRDQSPATLDSVTIFLELSCPVGISCRFRAAVKERTLARPAFEISQSMPHLARICNSRKISASRFSSASRPSLGSSSRRERTARYIAVFLLAKLPDW